jgi:hypothetical protein
MSTDLMITDSYDPAIAAMLGQDTGNIDSGPPRLKINSYHDIEIDSVEYPLKAGAFTLYRPNNESVYSTEVSFRPMLQRFQWNQWNESQKKETAASVMIKNWRETPYDSNGTVACGKIRGEKGKPENLSPQQKLLQKEVSTYRVLYGTVTMLNAKTAKGEVVETIDAPCVFRMRGTNLMAFADIDKRLTAAKLFLPNVQLPLTTKREKNGSTVYYVVTFSYDPMAPRRVITPEDMALIKDFNTQVNSFNAAIMEQHKTMLRSTDFNPLGIEEENYSLAADFEEKGSPF